MFAPKSKYQLRLKSRLAGVEGHGVIGLGKRMKFERRLIGIVAHPRGNIERVDAIGREGLLVGGKTVVGAFPRSIGSPQCATKGVLVPRSVFHTGDEQVVRFGIGGSTDETQLSLFEIGNKAIYAGEVEREERLTALILSAIVAHEKGQFRAVGVLLLGTRGEIGVCHGGKRTLGKRALRATGGAIEEIDEAIDLRIEFRGVARHIGVLGALGRDKSFVGVVVVHEAEILPANEAGVLQELQTGILIPSSAVVLGIDIPACALLNTRSEMDVLDIELGNEAWVVVGPRGACYLVVGAESIVEIDGCNIAIAVGHIDYALDAARYAMEAAAENHVVGVNCTDSRSNDAVVSLRQADGVGFFLRLGDIAFGRLCHIYIV